jgi:uncharacterized protein (TIGR03437 family)
MRTGAAVDGGLNCTACHRGDPPNSDRTGSLTIEAASYVPGVAQTVRVTVHHPDAMRWGFQLTARYANDERRMAGTFAVTDLIRVQCAAPGTDAPCNGLLEFASHNANSTRLGSNGRSTFEVRWTPPAADVGDIVFYAAGNAANDSLNNQGDLIYRSAAVVRNANGCNLPGAPSIGGLTSSASGAANTALNALASLWGVNFSVPGRGRNATEAETFARKYPTRMDCVEVLVRGERVPITYAGPGQINIQGPLRGLGGADVQVVANPGTSRESRSAVFNSIVDAFQPAFFTFNGTSVAATTADGQTTIANPAVVANGRPARPGETITIYATGLGFSQPVWAPGDIVRGQAPLENQLTIRVGGIAIPASDILYAGLAPESISGLYQINLRLPANISPGNQPITVTVSGATSSASTTVPIGS